MNGVVAMNPIERAEQQLKALESAIAAPPAEPQPPNEPAQQQTIAPQEPTPPATPPVEQPPAAPQQDPQIDFYQKWRTLDGMLKKKDERIEELGNQNKELLSQLTELASAVRQQQAHTAAPADSLAPLVERFGQDTVDAINKVTATQYGTIIKEQAQQLADLRAQMEALTGETSKVVRDVTSNKALTFQSALAEKVPDWRAILHSDRFHYWLDAKTDDLTGQTYRALYDLANTSFNLGTMVTIFNRFKSENQPVAPVPDAREAMITPGGAPAGTPATPAAKIWTQAEIMQAYTNQRRGLYTPEQWAQIEHDMDMAALVEGRVRN